MTEARTTTKMRRIMAPRTVKRLYDLEIDEISLVDRPANQHGVVAIAKRAEGHSMGIYDAAGDEVFEDELEHGDVVYDDAGNEFVFVEDDGTTADLQSGMDYEDEFEDDGELVGKSRTFVVDAAGRAETATRRAIGAGRRDVPGPGFLHRSSTRALERSGRLRGQSRSAFAGDYVDDAGRQYSAGRRAKLQSRGRAAQARGLEVYGNNPRQVAGAAAGTVAVGGSGEAYRRNRRGVKKSLGESVYEELSKALTTSDRDEVISKMANEVEIYKSQAEQAMDLVEELAYERDLEHYTEIAKGYGLPVDPERLGVILKNAVDTLPEEDVADLDRLLTAQGEMFDEIGSGLGMQDSEIMSQIEALSYEAVGKADISQEQAVVALFDANPQAYDEYLAEQGR